jgi:hypothetical protein
MFLLAVGLMCLTACAQKKGGERGPRMGGGMSVNKDSDSAFVALKNDLPRKAGHSLLHTISIQELSHINACL